MTVSIADYLKVVTADMSLALVSANALSKIETLAKNLPPLAIAAFECRLQPDNSRVDFSVSLPFMTINPPTLWLSHPVWQSIQKLSQEWVVSSYDLRGIIDRNWLEFDLTDSCGSILVPCLAFSLNQTTFNDPQLWRKVTQFLFNIQNHSHPQPLQKKLNHCLKCLPENARISHIGAMLSRPTKPIRLVVTGIAPKEITNYLNQVGWTDNNQELSLLIETLATAVDSISLAFDVEEEIAPTIGLECYFNRSAFNEKEWKSFLDNYLIPYDLCTRQKRSALLEWIGISDRFTHPQLWPHNLTFLDFLLGNRYHVFFNRTINHIKLVYQPGEPLLAKAYLFFQYFHIKINNHEL
ncbi:hypothetical protein PCC8801_0284 [Rippkaea orientalis PCC 8801]|uniref:Uncharacterized protein n=1 Tax=Rippkaea orientalis (strain PCC 8801 / RF-1) TaxID=41431 RepID=B7K364_RIPO1|nr:hypothetical protein [Rippkaea orientalis]ACK64384.1 hypothetical protein PCC8801_0284 [Rippkaea orientalis PCC 8801]